MNKLPVSFAGSAASPESFPRDGLPEVAFLGRSNVGKSSLLNALAGRKGLARVSATPGRTRLVNFYRMGNEMYFADLPGYGYAKVPERVRRGWERLCAGYLAGREPLALAVLLVDARHPATDGDEVLRGFLEELRVPYVVAATKADKLKRAELGRRLRELQGGLGRGARDVLPVSARSGAGTRELWRTIRAAAEERRARVARPAAPRPNP